MFFGKKPVTKHSQFTVTLLSLDTRIAKIFGNTLRALYRQRQKTRKFSFPLTLPLHVHKHECMFSFPKPLPLFIIALTFFYLP